MSFTVFISRFNLYRKGVIHRIPLDKYLDNLGADILSENTKVKINKIFRLKKKDRESNKWLEFKSVYIELKGHELP